MTTEVGTVTKKTGAEVRVQLGRTGACTGCKLCILASDGYMLASAKNTIDANVGDVVKVQYDKPGQVRSGFILYILPLLAFVPGYFLTSSFGAPYAPSTKDALGFIGGLLGIAISYLCIYLLGRAGTRKNHNFETVAILSSKDDNAFLVE